MTHLVKSVEKAPRFNGLIRSVILKLNSEVEKVVRKTMVENKLGDFASLRASILKGLWRKRRGAHLRKKRRGRRSEVGGWNAKG